MDRFDKFTDRARKVLTLAQDEAQRFNHNYIGTEHLLLGLVREGEGVAARVLENMNVELAKVRTAVEFIIGRGDRPVVGEVGLTPRAKRVIELAIDEARRLGHNYIGTEHLLLGLVREGEGIAAGVLESLGVNLDKVRHEVIRVLSQRPRPVPPRRRSAPRKTPTVDQLGIDLTEPPGRASSTRSSAARRRSSGSSRSSSRRKKNNPALIGEPGVGKTAIAEGLAQRIVAGDVPETLLRQARADPRHRLARRGHEVPRRVRGAPQEDHRGAPEHERRVLFIDELHTLVGAGAAEGAIDAANILKPPLARGELQCIGATTLDEYRKYIERDAALERRFQPVMVEEPTLEETDRDPQGHPRALRAAPQGRDHRRGREGRRRAVDPLHHRPPPARQGDRPHRRGRVAASACATRPRRRALREAQQELDRVTKEKDAAINNQEYEEAAPPARGRGELAREGREAPEPSGSAGRGDQPTVDEEDIAQVVAMWTGIPVTRIAAGGVGAAAPDGGRAAQPRHRPAGGDRDRLEGRPPRARRAQGSEAADRLVHLPRPHRRREDRARQGARRVHVRQRGRAHQDRHERVHGAPQRAPPRRRASRLRRLRRGRPAHRGRPPQELRVVLLDEIEKAHPEVFNILLQILEDGHLTDAKGRRVDFRNTIIIMTSNLGAKQLQTNSASASGPGDDRRGRGRELLRAHEGQGRGRAEERFRPEFLNRIDATVVFRSLTVEEIRRSST